MVEKRTHGDQIFNYLIVNFKFRTSNRALDPHVFCAIIISIYVNDLINTGMFFEAIIFAFNHVLWLLC